jgi:succinyl-CoA synthetase beta subunit
LKLYEFEAKGILARYGVSTPKGFVVAKGDDVRGKLASSGLTPPLVVKSQVLVAGRGKAGGVRIARSVEEAVSLTEFLFDYPIKGLKPRYILVEEAVEHSSELYASITIDKSARRPVVLASLYGGMDIEEIAREKPESIVRYHVDPYMGLRGFEARLIAKKLGLKGGVISSFASLLQSMYNAFVDYSADLVEVNPLTIVGEKVVALDARIIVDDNASYKYPELAIERVEGGEVSEWESRARRLGLAFVELEGDVGVMGNGAGLTMTSMDLVYEYGGVPANFLDIGGGASAERVKKAVLFLLEFPKAKSIFINIFGGITRCDEVARGIIEALKEYSGKPKPVFVRLSGTREEEGRRLLEEFGIRAFDNPLDAVVEAIRAAR